MTIRHSSLHRSNRAAANRKCTVGGENTKEEDLKWRTAKMEVLHGQMRFLKTDEGRRYHD